MFAHGILFADAMYVGIEDLFCNKKLVHLNVWFIHSVMCVLNAPAVAVSFNYN